MTALKTKVQCSKKEPNPVLDKLVADMNKKFGANAITRGYPKDSEGKILAIQRIPTGSISLDISLGGGIPMGRFIEVSGAYSSTKTTQCLHIVREAQKMGLVCAFEDIEGTTDEPYMRSLGIDTDALLYSRPDGMEEATQMLIDMQRSGEVQVGVLDSVAALSPIKEQESDMEDTTRMGIPQQLMGEYCRKFQASNNRLSREGKTPFTILAINQLREKIGAYGDPEYTPGGRAKGFTATIDLRLRRGDWIQEGKGESKEIVGQTVKYKIDKNKTFKRMQTGEFDFYFAKNASGIPVGYNDNCKEVIMCGIEWGVIERAGAWFKYNGEKYQGLAELISALKADPKLVDILRREVLDLAIKVGRG